MARSVWSGNLSFGLVTIPVDLYTAVHDQDFDFTMLDRRDNSPVGYKRVNKKTGEEVPFKEIVKGYEHEKGEFVILTDEDFKSANVEATHTADIFAFVGAESIPPAFMVKPYYVVPPKKSARAYVLLRETMRRTGRVALARVVIRTRQHLAALFVQDDMLVLELLRFGEEVVKTDEYAVPGDDLAKLGVTEKELKMAEQLVAGLEDQWTPDLWRDEYRADLLALIEKKAEHGDTAVKVAAPPKDEGGEVVDIMELLKRSVAATNKSENAKPKKAARR